MKKIVIVGLGLIGGSLAAALRGFEGYTVTGVDIDEKVLEFARENRIADRLTADTEAAVSEGDLIICCMHPDGIVRFLNQYAGAFKPGTLVTDVCGVKAAVMAAAASLPDTIDFIGGHPMAGKERGGIENFSPKLFIGSHYIITPRPGGKSENIELMRRIANHLGSRDLVVTTPERHDEIIAYTSQIMHILACAICDDPIMFDCLGFEGGSFRDCTRVAALDAKLWSELFGMNGKALSAVIGRLEDSLKSYREVIEENDAQALYEKLKYSSDRKRQMNIEHSRGDDYKETPQG